MVYRVVDHPMVRYHRGEMTLEPRSDGTTRLTWHVEFRFVLPGIGALVVAGLRRELSKSLDALEALAREVGASTAARRGGRKRRSNGHDPHAGWAWGAAPEPHFADDLDALYARAEAVLAEQREHAAALARTGDRKRWFPLVYQYVTEEQIHRCRKGLVTHPGWVLRIIDVFHQYYWRNYEAWEVYANARTRLPPLPLQANTAVPDALERHWRIAFNAMERPRSERTAMFLGLHRAIVAHIQHDLPRALAEVYVDHYAGFCGYDRFRADYLLMGDVFALASRRAIAQMNPTYIPWRARALHRVLPPEAEMLLQQRYFYDISGERRKAFERGKAFAETLLRREATTGGARKRAIARNSTARPTPAPGGD